MLSIFSTWARDLVPHASAAATNIHISDIGSRDPAVQAMWSKIANIFPYVNIGSGAVSLLGSKLVDFILLMIGSIAVAVILFSALRIIASRGEDIEEPKKALLYAVLGLVLAVLADVIVRSACTIAFSAAGGTTPQCSWII